MSPIRLPPPPFCLWSLRVEPLTSLRSLGVTPKRHLAEFKGFDGSYKLGDTICADLFTEADFVDIVGVSKGKGFQGVVKRHGFGGVGQSTHGQHNRLRAPGFSFQLILAFLC